MPESPIGGDAITNRFDFNRDGLVDLVDWLIVRRNVATGALRLTMSTAASAH
jgi:hypothetical protein